MKILSRIFLTMIAFLFSFGIYSNTADAKANIELTITEVNFSKGECYCAGYFENSGDSAGVVTDTQLDITFTDPNDRRIWFGSKYFGQVDCYVEAGERSDWQFFMHDEEIPEYYGQYNWNVNNQIWWNNL